MESRRPVEGGPQEDAADFVRFCYRRRQTGWPELYDEMCAVASRALYRGWGFTELADHGIGFSLFDLPRLAAIATRIAADEREGRSRMPVPVMAVRADGQAGIGRPEPRAEDRVTPPHAAPGQAAIRVPVG